MTANGCIQEQKKDLEFIQQKNYNCLGKVCNSLIMFTYDWDSKLTNEMDVKNYYQEVVLPRTSSSIWQWHLTSEEESSVSYLKANLFIHGVVN